MHAPKYVCDIIGGDAREDARCADAYLEMIKEKEWIRHLKKEKK